MPNETVKVTLNKEAVINQYPDMLIKAEYFATDTFEGGLVYGSETIRKEPPLNRFFYMFPEGAAIKYLGNNEWQLEANILNKDAIKSALRKITPVTSKEI